MFHIANVVFPITDSTLSLHSHSILIGQDYKLVFPVERLHRDYKPNGLPCGYIFLKKKKNWASWHSNDNLAFCVGSQWTEGDSWRACLDLLALLFFLCVNKLVLHFRFSKFGYGESIPEKWIHSESQETDWVSEPTPLAEKNSLRHPEEKLTSFLIAKHPQAIPSASSATFKALFLLPYNYLYTLWHSM